jgi:hypothetical protein
MDVRIFFASSHNKMTQNFRPSSVHLSLLRSKQEPDAKRPPSNERGWSYGSGIEKAPETADARYCWTGALHVVYQRRSLNVPLSGSTSGSARVPTYSRYIRGFRV